MGMIVFSAICAAVSAACAAFTLFRSISDMRPRTSFGLQGRVTRPVWRYADWLILVSNTGVSNIYDVKSVSPGFAPQYETAVLKPGGTMLIHVYLERVVDVDGASVEEQAMWEPGGFTLSFHTAGRPFPHRRRVRIKDIPQPKGEFVASRTIVDAGTGWSVTRTRK